MNPVADNAFGSFSRSGAPAVSYLSHIPLNQRIPNFLTSWTPCMKNHNALSLNQNCSFLIRSSLLYFQTATDCPSPWVKPSHGVKSFPFQNKHIKYHNFLREFDINNIVTQNIFHYAFFSLLSFFKRKEAYETTMLFASVFLFLNQLTDFLEI